MTLLSGDDANLIEVNQLRAEVARLRPIAEAAEYLEGVAGCLAEEPGDEECDEYFDPATGDRNEVELCSHVRVLHASSADQAGRRYLEDLIGDLRTAITNGDGALSLLEQLDEGLYNIAYYLGDYSHAGQAIAQQDPYRSVVAAELADLRQSRHHR